MEAVKIKTDLKNLGIKENDTIVIHSSYKNLCGNIKIKPDAVIEVFKETVKSGTLMLPALSYESVTPQNRIFDVLSTPCCVGILPEVMRKSEGAYRSVHPTHSIAVWGKDAQEIAAAHIRDFTPVGANSPLHELKRRKGKIVMLGCGLEPNTSMHGVEEMVVPEYLYGANYDYDLVMSDGKLLKTNILSHNFSGVEQRYDKILDVLDKTDYKSGKVLNAECYVLDAEAVWEKALIKLRENPVYFIEKEIKEN
ncbi:MAG: AAC(3) family N-acetyltransferase [Treponema sp.]|nr:AAC(3) family N-acetyltransferase [Treponema sp.]MCL2271844.1 AAC(3) family N-acetyltransferase [Treponema sp.]